MIEHGVRFIISRSIRCTKTKKWRNKQTLMKYLTRGKTSFSCWYLRLEGLSNYLYRLDAENNEITNVRYTFKGFVCAKINIYCTHKTFRNNNAIVPMAITPYIRATWLVFSVSSDISSLSAWQLLLNSSRIVFSVSFDISSLSFDISSQSAWWLLLISSFNLRNSLYSFPRLIYVTHWWALQLKWQGIYLWV